MIIDAANPGVPRGMDTTERLIPNLNEYVDMLTAAVRNNNNAKPPHICIDAESMMDSLSAVLEDTGIKVHYYPPPSEEEKTFNDMTNPYLNDPYQQPGNYSGCCFCSRVSQADGQPLMRCGGCNTFAYCSKQCQTAHWPNHKRDCKRIKQQRQQQYHS